MPTAVAEKPETATAFEPVEFWNVKYPNEWVLVDDAPDPAARRYAKFFAGYFKANTAEEVAAIETHAKHAKRGNTPNSLQCAKCGWSTKNSDLFQVHMNEHP